MDRVQGVYQTTVQAVSGFAGPVINTVKHKFTGVAGAARNNVLPILTKSYAVCNPVTSCYDELIHFLMLGPPCRAEQILCHR